MKKPFYSSKAFVNLAGANSDASIFSQIMFYSDESSGYEASLKMRDCGSNVHFIIGLNEDGDRSYENTLFKLDTFISELTNFRDAIVKAKVVYDERIGIEERQREEAVRKFESKHGDSKPDSGMCAHPHILNPGNTPLGVTNGLEDIQGTVPIAPNVQ